MVGSMGCVTPLALGLALARPDLHVVALDGDGAALMRMGAFATVGAYGPPNLMHLLLDNGVHDSTGGQATVSPQRFVCRDCRGLRLRVGARNATIVAVIDDVARRSRRSTARGSRALFDSPRHARRPAASAITPVDVKTRLMQHFGAAEARSA